MKLESRACGLILLFWLQQYLETILEKHGADELSYFEVNLETWRQLWRVIEMADVVLLITDIRHPVSMRVRPTSCCSLPISDTP